MEWPRDERWTERTSGMRGTEEVGWRNADHCTVRPQTLKTRAVWSRDSHSQYTVDVRRGVVQSLWRASHQTSYEFATPLPCTASHHRTGTDTPRHSPQPER